MYSCRPLHMDEQRQDDQLEPTYSSSVLIWDVNLKTSQKQLTIGRGGERGSGISMLMVRRDDDDDDDIYIYIYIYYVRTCMSIYLCIYIYMFILKYIYIHVCIYIYIYNHVYICVCVCVCAYIYEDHSISFQTFFVWALLLIVHTWNSSPLRSNLLQLQCTCTVPTASGWPHGSPLVWACQWPSSQPPSSPQLSYNDSLWAYGITKSHRDQGVDCREAEELSWCPSWSNSVWTGVLSCWKCHWPDLKSAGFFRQNLFLNSL